MDPVVSIGPVLVAGDMRADPLGVVRGYLAAHGGTVCHYDFVAGTSAKLTHELIRATRSPWMNSRISKVEEAWLLDRAAAAPWANTTVTDSLADADPTVSDGLYDRANELYAHFRDAAPKGIAQAKVSKVLYLMRPALFPILDSRVAKLYRHAAKETASKLARVGPALFAHGRSAPWAAIREDLVTNSDAITQIRSALGASAHEFEAQCGARLTDLRILDILMWRSE